MYLENVDLCLRAKKNNGKLFIVQKSKINHLGAKAVDEKFHEQIEYSRNWHWMWSKFYFNKKYKGILISLIIGLTSLLINSFKYFIYMLILNKIKKKAYLMRISGLWNSMIVKTSWYRPKV